MQAAGGRVEHGIEQCVGWTVNGLSGLVYVHECAGSLLMVCCVHSSSNHVYGTDFYFVFVCASVCVLACMCGALKDWEERQKGKREESMSKDVSVFL